MADDIAAALVEEELTACSTALAAGRRTWGGVVAEPEVVLPAETTADGYGPLRDRVVEFHFHEVPCVEWVDESDLLDASGERVTASVD